MKTIPTTSESDWLEKRRVTGVGASEAAILCGVGRFKSEYQLWLEKLGLDKEDARYAEQSKWGHLLEDPIAAAYEDETGRKTMKPPPGTLYCDEEHPFMLCTLDRWQTIDPGDKFYQTQEALTKSLVVPLEIKTAHWNLKGNWKEEPPIEYVIQVQHQLAVTGAPVGSVAALVGGMMFLWCDVSRDDEFIAQLRTIEGEFWRKCEQRIAPAVDGSEQTKKALARLYAQDTGEIISFPATLLEADNLREQASKELDRWTEEKRLAENQIRAALGAASAGTFPNGVTYTLKLQHRKETVQKATSFRVLRRLGAK